MISFFRSAQQSSEAHPKKEDTPFKRSKMRGEREEQNPTNIQLIH
jgi:hypothetical protein